MKNYYPLLLLIFNVTIVFSQSNTQISPLNPDFIDYQYGLDKLQLDYQNKDIHSLGLIPSPVLPNFAKTDSELLRSATFTTKYDLRTAGPGSTSLLTPVKNQGTCGSCWAFAAMGSIEGFARKKGYGEYDFSENNLKECHGFMHSACDGGNSDMISAYLARKSGVISEIDDPYTENEVGCKGNLNPEFWISDIRFIPNNGNVIKQAILDFGALATNMYMNESYFNDNDNTYYSLGGTSTNHAVVLVGWDDAKITAGGTGAWIIKNSWGSTWGEDGYFYVSYNDPLINKKVTSYRRLTTPVNNSTQFGYDQFGLTVSLGWNSNIGYGIVKFSTGDKDYLLKQLSTYVRSGPATVSFEVYDDFDGTNLSNFMGSITDKNCDLPGYYTFDFNNPLQIIADNDFFIKVFYNTIDYNFPIPLEGAISNYVNPIIESGKCWISSNGTSWLALGADQLRKYDLCIKAYGEYVTCTPPTIESSAFSVSESTNNSMNINWTRGNGTSVLVVARAKNEVNAVPVDGESYTANSVFKSGTQIGNGNYVVYNGTGTSVNITSLISGTPYYFKIFEYNSTSNCYLLKHLTGNGKTLGSPPSIIVQNGLIAYYPFEGNANDESGNENNGTVVGNVVLTSDRFNNPNEAYEFPGTSFNYIKVDNSINLALDTFSINAWVYTTTDYGSGIVVNKNRDILEGHYGLNVQSIGGTVNYYGCNGTRAIGKPVSDKWHMITGSIIGDKATFFLDGVIKADTLLSYAFHHYGSEPLTIGMHYYEGVPDSWTYPFKGKIDDVRIYNRILCESEIDSLYNQGFIINNPPVANAGVDQTVNKGTIVTLDGSASTDANNDVLTYKWTSPAGITLSSTTVAKPTFTAPQVTSDTTYTFSLVVNDSTFDSPADQVKITVTNSTPSHFTVAFIGNGQDHMNLNIMTATMNATALQAGDEIAAFDGDICCGKITLTQPIHFSDNNTFVSIAASKADDGQLNGYTVGNAITYKFWDSSEGKEFSHITPEYFDPGTGQPTTVPTYTANGSAFVKLAGRSVYTHEIPFISGWNIISSNVVPSKTNLKEIIQPLIDGGKLKKIMDESGKAIENFGAFGGWKNNIGNFTQTEGYKVNMAGVDTLVLEGAAITLPLEIPLIAGWNIISYPCENAQNAQTMVQSLVSGGKLKKVMDESGKSIENFGAFGGWKNNIGNMVSGKGFKINMTGIDTLTITSSVLRSATTVPEIQPSTYFIKAFIGNGTDHMNINLVDLANSCLMAGDEIGVFDGKICVGSATIGIDQIKEGTISIPTSCNDGLEETANGFTPGHAITIRLYSNGETNIVETENLWGSIVFEKDGSLFAKVKSRIPTSLSLTGEPMKFVCYPNPFKDEMRIDVTNTQPTDITVEIFNLYGQKVKMLYDGINTGTLNLKWDGTDQNNKLVSNGVYFCKIGDQTKKIVFLGIK